MKESDFPWNEFSEQFEEVRTDMLLDPVLKEAAEYSELIAMELTEKHKNKTLVVGEGGDVERAIRRLDGKVHHLLGEVVIVDGPVQLSGTEAEDEADFTEVAGRSLVFNGFIGSARNDRIEIDYQLGVLLDENGGLLDITKGENTGYRYAYLQARPSKIRLDFDIKHPLQAFAWLEAVAPDVIAELDESVIRNDGNFSAHTIESLGSFSLTPSDHVSTPRAEEQLLNAVNQYVSGMISVATLVPYRADASGPMLLRSVNDEGLTVYEPATVSGANLLVSFAQPYLGKEDESYTFMAQVVIHPDVEDDPCRVALAKLRRFSNIRTVR